MSDSHDASQMAAFLNEEIKVGSFTLRPLTAGSLAVLQGIGNAFFTGGDEEEEAGPESGDLDAETIDALCEYIFCHVKDPVDLVKLARNPDDFRDAAKAFCFEITVPEFGGFLGQMMRIQEATAAVIVEPLEDEDSEPGKHQQSPTGSQTLSSCSGQQEIKKESATSSGDCLSQDPSNTSTQLTEPTERDADSSTCGENAPPDQPSSS